jgi:opacity protein-like surface antigen
MRKILIFLTAILILTTVASAASAQSYKRGELTRSERWDFTIQTRYTSSSDYSDPNGSALSIESDLGWGFGFGYNFNQHFNLGLLFTWRSVPYQARAVDAEGSGEDRNYSGSMSTSTFGLSGEYNVLKGKITPYVNGSFGWVHINTNIPAGWTSGCYWYPYYGYICGPVPLTYGSNETAYTLGLGGRFEMSESVFLRGGYEWGWISIDELDTAGMVRIDIGFMF